MTTATKMYFEDMNIAQLQEAHSDMLATASDLGFSPPEELVREFDTQEAGAALCTKLHAAIEKFSAGIDSEKPLADETEKGQSAPSSVETKKSQPKGNKKKASADEPPKPASTKPKKPAAKSAAPASKEVKENTVAKKAVKKTAKKATAKKAAAPKKAKASTGAHALKMDGVITVKTKDKENPCRKGSGKFERVAQIFKFDGKSVQKAVDAGVKKGSLNFCVEQGWISIK